jgi:hypothetical protein
MYVMLSVDMWFCDHLEWWLGWVGGRPAAPFLEQGLTFGVGRGYSHTCVYVEFL